MCGRGDRKGKMGVLILTTQTGTRNCEASARGTRAVRMVAWAPTLIASAVLFSLFFAATEPLAWLGMLGFVPLGLRLTGCPTCGGMRQPPSSAVWPGH